MIQNKNEFFRYSGAIHIHSCFSDGSGDVGKIAKAAKNAGLKWIIVTDHNNMDIEEGVINGVCVIKGNEISLEHKNHYLTIGTNNILYENEPAKFVESVRKDGGFGFAAHPFESEKRKNSYKPIRWDCSVIPDGIEIWNWFSQWGNRYNDENILNIIYSFLFRHELVEGADNESLIWWDKLNNMKTEIVPAIGGLDVHAMKIKKYLLPVTVFPYREMFGTVTNVLILKEQLSNDFEIQKKQIFSALKNGNNLIINRKIMKNIPGIKIENSNGIIGCGETIFFDCNTSLYIEQSKKCYVRILKDGAEYESEFGRHIKIKIKHPGKYRVELKYKDQVFAYSNPMNVLEVKR